MQALGWTYMHAHTQIRQHFKHPQTEKGSCLRPHRRVKAGGVCTPQEMPAVGLLCVGPGKGA